MKKTGRVVLIISAVLIGLYPLIYFIIDRQFGLLGSKSPELLKDTLWNIGFYGHILLGGLALLIGWIQFSEKLIKKNILLHKKIGKTYIISVLISGICGFYIGFYATGGVISSLGFIALAIIWLTTTILGFNAARNGEIELHKKLMIYSYAACFSAVTLRLWLPLLTTAFGDFIIAYRIVAWLCWVPNIIVAFFIVRNKENPKRDIQNKHK